MSQAASRLIPNPSSVMLFFAFVGPIMNIIVLIVARTILGEGSYSAIGLWLSMALLALAALLSFKLIAAISADV